jgi:6-phosphogluconolactonase (cycloisomerase 2 family)
LEEPLHGEKDSPLCHFAAVVFPVPLKAFRYIVAPIIFYLERSSMIAWKFASVKPSVCHVCFIVLVLSLCLAACGGGSGSSGNAGGGTGSGGTGSVGPASGEYLWQVGSQYNLSYATINTTTGALGAPTVAGGPAFDPFNYPSIAVPPTGNFLYAFYWTLGELETFQMIGPGLQVNLMPGVLTLQFEQSVTIHPGGKFLYVIESGAVATIQEVSINTSSGALTLGPTVTEKNADLRVGIVDPAGNFLFVNDLTGGKIFVYQVNKADGTLSPVANSPFTLPSNEQPTYIAIGGSGNSLFLYADLYSRGIAAFSFNTSTGALTLVPGSPFQTGSNAPDYICADPSGRFLYGSDSLDGSIIGLAINPSDGTLSSVPGSPFSVAPLAGTIAIDPSGKFLYVANEKDSTIYGFGLNSATGGLSALAGSPFPSVPQPESLTMMKIP